MPYIDGLPVASSVGVNDLVLLGQGGVTGYAGSAVSRTMTVAEFMALSYPMWVASFPTSDPHVLGAIWNNNGILSISMGTLIGVYGSAVYGGALYA